MRRHRVSPSPFLWTSSHITELRYTNSYTYSDPNLNFLQYTHYTDTRPTHNVVCPSGAWIENRPHLTPSIRLVRNPKHVIVQWVGIGTYILLILFPMKALSVILISEISHQEVNSLSLNKKQIFFSRNYKQKWMLSFSLSNNKIRTIFVTCIELIFPVWLFITLHFFFTNTNTRDNFQNKCYVSSSLRDS